MEKNDLPIKRLNEFLENYLFDVEYILESELSVKVQITGIKQMISGGDWKDLIQYTIFLEKSNMEVVTKFLNIIFENIGTNEYDISTTDTTFYQITNKVGNLLNDFLKYWSIDNRVICTKIVNNLNKN